MIRTLIASLYMLVFFMNTSYVFAMEKDEINRYLNLLKVGCSVDTSTELHVSADGKLMILGKMKVGGTSFQLDKSEINNILLALKDDTLKDSQATEQRKCQQHYLDKIFELIAVKDKASAKPITEKNQGILYEFSGCSKEGSRNLICSIKITSIYQDREFSVMLRGGSGYGKPTKLFDQDGNEYIPSKINIANKSGEGRILRDILLVADISYQMNMYFTNVSSQLSRVSLLKMYASSKLNGKHNSAIIDFRDPPLL